MIDLTRTSNKVNRPIKPIEHPTKVEELRRKKPCCPKCKHEDFEGFGTSYGPFRRCKKCNNEWAAGGIGIIATLPAEEREALKTLQSSFERDDAYNNANDINDEADRKEEIKISEQYSGANRDFWRYWGIDGDESDEYYTTIYEAE